ncbi:sensor histidine kinase [Agaribacter marinus]|uniref:histidine kinase n=1 Tax=Agaribacter marinus TaxID=1431249 RepID=A0AA37T169_9ALTE|nr:ATP-binding protein [Agaribacter marinus]GLR70433.1 two-component sensor histidine kinase [Agaribacter marinus]
MANTDAYKVAYERERFARKNAEKLLDEKSRSLYNSVVKLQDTVAALEETQDQLVQSEKMASIGQLAAGVAHEINNPIGFSLSNLTTLTEYVASFIKLNELVTDNLAELKTHNFAQEYELLRESEGFDFITDDVKELLSETVQGLNRVSAIVANLKKVTHAGELNMEPADINNIIEDSIKVVWNELKYNMEIEKQLSPMPQVTCHSGEIHQVFMNLFLNASHACGDKGILSLKTSTLEKEGKQWVAITVSDNGKGMPEDVRKKIFDPFFTTKPVGVGTGLGLSVSFGIIEKHQGTIKVKSEEGKGTTFIVCLPIEAETN